MCDCFTFANAIEAKFVAATLATKSCCGLKISTDLYSMDSYNKPLFPFSYISFFNLNLQLYVGLHWFNSIIHSTFSKNICLPISCILRL